MYKQVTKALILWTGVILSMYYEVEFFELLSVAYIWLIGVICAISILRYDILLDTTVKKIKENNDERKFIDYTNSPIARFIVFGYTVFAAFATFEAGYEVTSFVLVFIAVLGQLISSSVKKTLGDTK